MLKTKRLPLLLFFVFNVLLFTFSAMPAEAAGANQTEVLRGVFSGGIDDWVRGTATGLIEEEPVTANTTEVGSVNVFKPIIAPVTVLDNEEYKAEMEAHKEIAYDIAYLCLLLIVAYILLQELDPDSAYDISKFINGRATYYYPKDIIKYALKVGLWFVLGGTLLYGMVWHNNYLISDADTGVLDQVVVSSDNLSNYFTLGICVKFLKFYFSVRESFLVYAMEHWYYLGVILFFKVSRWVGVIFLQYIAVQIYVQALIVGILTTSVAHVMSTNPHGSDMLHFAGTSIELAVIVFIAVTIPIWIRLLSPNTWRFILRASRVV